MMTHSIRVVQRIPADLQTTWLFFSNPMNLRLITPPYLHFRILSTFQGDLMYAGQIIEYTVRPFLNIPQYWMTEITNVTNLRLFVDEQRFGPYRFWHHQHHFRPISGGVEMTDLVHYRVPFGFLGNFAHWLWLKRQIVDIFDFRSNQIEAHFGKWAPNRKPKEEDNHNDLFVV